MMQLCSYERHVNKEAAQAEALRLPSCYTDAGSVDAWRHARMHRFLLPLIEGDAGATWMTVGDGNFGSDAHFLEQQGLDVLATSLTDSSLKIAHAKIDYCGEGVLLRLVKMTVY